MDSPKTDALLDAVRELTQSGEVTWTYKPGDMTVVVELELRVQVLKEMGQNKLRFLNGSTPIFTVNGTNSEAAVRLVELVHNKWPV